MGWGGGVRSGACNVVLQNYTLVYKRGDKNLIKETVKKVKMLQNFTFEKMLRKEQKMVKILKK